MGKGLKHPDTIKGEYWLGRVNDITPGGADITPIYQGRNDVSFTGILTLAKEDREIKIWI